MSFQLSLVPSSLQANSAPSKYRVAYTHFTAGFRSFTATNPCLTTTLSPRINAQAPPNGAYLRQRARNYQSAFTGSRRHDLLYPPSWNR